MKHVKDVQEAQEWAATTWSRQGRAGVVSKYLRTCGFPHGRNSDTALDAFRRNLADSCRCYGRVTIYYRLNKRREILGEIFIGFADTALASRAYEAHGWKCLWGSLYPGVTLETSQEDPNAWAVGASIGMEQVCMQREGSPTDPPPAPDPQVECVICKQPATGFRLCRRCFGSLGCTRCGEDQEGGFVCKDCLAEDRGPARDPPEWLSSKPLAPWIERCLEEVVPREGSLPRLRAGPPLAAAFPHVLDLRSLDRYGFAGPNAVADWLGASQSNVYVGGKCDKPGADSSPWDNTFGQDEEGLAKYEAFIQTRGSPSVFELRGKVLGCWCTAPHCHALILRRLIEASTFSTVDATREWILSGEEDSDSLGRSFVQVRPAPSLRTWDTVNSGGTFSEASEVSRTTARSAAGRSAGLADPAQRVCDQWLDARNCDRDDCPDLR